MILPVLFFLLLTGGQFLNNKVGFWFILLVFSILIGFRGENVGTDTAEYMNLYESIGKNGYYGYPEVGYAYLNLLFYRLGFGFSVFQWILTCGMMFLIGRVVWKYSSKPQYSLFALYALFFVFYTMNVFRQMLAVSIVLYGYYFLCKKQCGWFVICVLLATLFHTSSIIALGILFISKLELKSVLCYGGPILSLLLGVFLLNDSLIVNIAGPYAEYLLNSDMGFRSEARMESAILLALFWSCLCFLIFLFSEKSCRNDFWFKIYFWSVVINNLLVRTELGLRIVFFFSIVQIIVFPFFLTHNRLKQKWIAYRIVTIFLTVFFFVLLYTGSASVYPYYNVLFDF